MGLDLGHFTEAYSMTLSKVLDFLDLAHPVPVSPENQSFCF